MIRLRNITIAIVALCALAVAVPAAFGSGQDVIRECYNTGTLTPGKYSRSELNYARHHLPSDIREYSDCADLIDAALAALRHQHRSSGGGNGGAAGGGGGGGGAGGSTPPAGTPLTAVPPGPNQQDLNALSSVTDPRRSAGVPPQVTLANGKLSPTTGGLLSAAKRTESNTVPLPLILSLAGLAAMAALGGAAVLRQRWPRTRAALRLRRR